MVIYCFYIFFASLDQIAVNPFILFVYQNKSVFFGMFDPFATNFIPHANLPSIEEDSKNVIAAYPSIDSSLKKEINSLQFRENTAAVTKKSVSGEHLTNV